MRPSLCTPRIGFAALVFTLPICGAAWGATPRSPAPAATGVFPALRAGLAPGPTLAIPGPLQPFLRMAAVSQEADLEEILPLLSHQIVLDGYSGNARSQSATEYLILLRRYVQQARQLRELAGADGVLRVSNCNQAQRLLDIIGYKFGQPCGPHVTVQTADPKRAFTAVDSGFPLVGLETALQSGKPFTYPFGDTLVPVLFDAGAWLGGEKNKGHADLLDALLADPQLARLYWALAQMDEETRSALRSSPGLQELLPLAPMLDFYGQQFRIHSGSVLVPGGPKAEAAWHSIIGVSPHSPGEFVMALFSKKTGWMAPFYDAVARANGPQQAYFTEPHRLQMLSQDFWGHIDLRNAAGSVFRPDAGLLLLTTMMPLDPDGQPHVPGGLNTWNEILRRANDSKLLYNGAAHKPYLKSSEKLIGLLLFLSRDGSRDGLVHTYLSLSEIDRARAGGTPLSPQTVLLLAESFSKYGAHYPIFSEFHALDDQSINVFVSTADAVSRIPDSPVRSEAVGIFQSLSGLWQILARQGEIPTADQNHSWQALLRPLGRVHSLPDLYDATRGSLSALMRAATGDPHISQDKLIELLAGPRPTSPQRAQVRHEIADRMRAVLEAQRLVSLDTLLTLGDGLVRVSDGKIAPNTLLPAAEELREFEMPKPIFSTAERLMWGVGRFGDSHTQAEMNTDIDETLRTNGASKETAAARGRLVPFMRDFLLGLNYAYYEPPGAQMLLNNPLFIRRHDFSGDLTHGSQSPWSSPQLVGRGETSAGGVRLSGGLALLPYALAQVEQQFIVPRNIQSLVWEDLVPALIASAVLPRWWQVTPTELHVVALYQEFGEALLESAGNDAELRKKVLGIMSGRLLSLRFARLQTALDSGHPDEFISTLTPAESFFLALDFQQLYRDEMTRWGTAGQELETLTHQYPDQTNARKLTADFGVPHPELGQTTARDLLSLRPFPTFLGYSSRLLAESWESNNLYWARLADEKGLPPESLNQVVPALTRRMAEDIFATDLDDWPALGRALRQAGDEFLDGKVQSLPQISALSPQ